MASDGSTSSITAQEQAPLQTEQLTTQLEALKSKTENLELELKIERLAIKKATDYAEEAYAEMNKWADSSDRFEDEVKRLEEEVKVLKKQISDLETELQEVTEKWLGKNPKERPYAKYRWATKGYQTDVDRQDEYITYLIGKMLREKRLVDVESEVVKVIDKIAEEKEELVGQLTEASLKLTKEEAKVQQLRDRNAWLTAWATWSVEEKVQAAKLYLAAAKNTVEREGAEEVAERLQATEQRTSAAESDLLLLKETYAIENKELTERLLAAEQEASAAKQELAKYKADEMSWADQSGGQSDTLVAITISDCQQQLKEKDEKHKAELEAYNEDISAYLNAVAQADSDVEQDIQEARTNATKLLNAMKESTKKHNKHRSTRKAISQPLLRRLGRESEIEFPTLQEPRQKSQDLQASSNMEQGQVEAFDVDVQETSLPDEEVEPISTARKSTSKSDTKLDASGRNSLKNLLATGKLGAMPGSMLIPDPDLPEITYGHLHSSSISSAPLPANSGYPRGQLQRTTRQVRKDSDEDDPQSTIDEYRQRSKFGPFESVHKERWNELGDKVVEPHEHSLDWKRFEMSEGEKILAEKKAQELSDEEIQAEDGSDSGPVPTNDQKLQTVNWKQDERERDWKEQTPLPAEVWQDSRDRLKPVPGKMHKPSGDILEEPTDVAAVYTKTNPKVPYDWKSQAPEVIEALKPVPEYQVKGNKEMRQDKRREEKEKKAKQELVEQERAAMELESRKADDGRSLVTVIDALGTIPRSVTPSPVPTDGGTLKEEAFEPCDSNLSEETPPVVPEGDTPNVSITEAKQDDAKPRTEEQVDLASKPDVEEQVDLASKPDVEEQVDLASEPDVSKRVITDNELDDIKSGYGDSTGSEREDEGPTESDIELEKAEKAKAQRKHDEKISPGPLPIRGQKERAGSRDAKPAVKKGNGGRVPTGNWRDVSSTQAVSQGNGGGQASRGDSGNRGGQAGRGNRGGQPSRGDSGNRGGQAGRGNQDNRGGQAKRGTRGGQASEDNRGSRGAPRGRARGDHFGIGNGVFNFGRGDPTPTSTPAPPPPPPKESKNPFASLGDTEV